MKTITKLKLLRLKLLQRLSKKGSLIVRIDPNRYTKKRMNCLMTNGVLDKMDPAIKLNFPMPPATLTEPGDAKVFDHLLQIKIITQFFSRLKDKMQVALRMFI